MGNEKKILSDVERIDKNRRIAEAYYAAYNKQAVKDGAVYDEWIYAPHADYWSPYFGNGTIDLETNPISVEDSATMEALSYSIEFREWAPVDFECFPAVNGVAWKTHFGGYRKSDVMMPKMDGYEMVAALRQMHTNIPILLITAKDSFLDLQKGFLTGADDYMTKPINEMVLRVQALLRRSQMNAEQRCVIGTTTLDYNAFSVTSGTKEQLLPQKEFLLLFKLLSNPGKAFTWLQLMDDVWGYDTDTDPHTVDVHIARLRNRFMDNPDFEIQTIRGMGYRAVKKG